MEGARQFEGVHVRGARGSSSETHTRRGIIFVAGQRRPIACLAWPEVLACA